jgi:hypothetical protein
MEKSITVKDEPFDAIENIKVFQNKEGIILD